MVIARIVGHGLFERLANSYVTTTLKFAGIAFT